MCRCLGVLVAATGGALVLWACSVWLWQDPVTGLYARWEQQRLASDYRERSRIGRSAPTPTAAAGAYRRATHRGDALGWLRIPRLGLSAVLVYGTDAASLREGPGVFPGDALPGEGRLVYIAGHRTTYGAPFAHIERLRSGDRISIALPYGTFVYRVTRHRIVSATDVGVLRSGRRERLILQACHPRFSASHRYLVYAWPVRARPQARHQA